MEATDLFMTVEFDFQGSRWHGIPIKTNKKTVMVEFAVEKTGDPSANIKILRNIKKHNVVFIAVTKEEVEDAIAS